MHLLQAKRIPGNYEPVERDLPEEFDLKPAPLAAFGLLRRRHGIPSLASILKNDIEHVADNREVSEEQSAAKEGDSPEKLPNFQRQQKGS